MKQRQAAQPRRNYTDALAGPATETRNIDRADSLSDPLPSHSTIKIMAVTFTNKAKKKKCVPFTLEELKDSANDVHIGIFHHYCLGVLQTIIANYPQTVCHCG